MNIFYVLTCGLFIILCLSAFLLFIFKQKAKPAFIDANEVHLSPGCKTKCKINVNRNLLLAEEGVYSKPCLTSTPQRNEDSSSCRVNIPYFSSSSKSKFNFSMSDSSSSSTSILDSTQSIGDIVEGNIFARF